MSNQRKRIFVITNTLPFPIDGGDTLRIFKICEHLSSSFELILVVPYNTKYLHYNAKNELGKVFSDIVAFQRPFYRRMKDILTAVIMGHPLQAAYYYNPEIVKYLQKIVSKDDRILCHLIRQYPNVGQLTDQTILEYTDAISMNHATLDIRSLKKILFKLDVHKLKRLEKKGLSTAGACCVIHDKDKAYFFDNLATSDVDIRVFQNGISREIQSTNIDTLDDFVIGFVGNCRSEQNHDAIKWFIDNIFLDLSRKYDDKIHLRIIGNVPKRKKKMLDKSAKITFTGVVDSIQNELRNCSIGVAPVFHGAGMQNKVLEYAAASLPIVGTTLAISPFHMKSQIHCIEANSAREFMHSIEDLMFDKNKCSILGQNAYAHAGMYSWSSVLSGYENLFL